MKPAAAAGSLAIHAALLAALLMSPPRAEQQRPDTPPPAGDAKNLRQAVKPLSVRLIKEEDGSAAAAPQACEQGSYSGIGIMTTVFGSILSIGQGTPAERAGLRLLDVIQNAEILAPDRHKEGTRLVLIVLRDGVELSVEVTIDRICYDR